MQKTQDSVSFTSKTTSKLQNIPVALSQKKNDMKVKLRQEISQVFH